MENAGTFYGRLVYFTVIWYILWQFGNVVVIWYIFPRFGILCHEKSGNPDLPSGSQEAGNIPSFIEAQYVCNKRMDTQVLLRRTFYILAPNKYFYLEAPNMTVFSFRKSWIW
jgi:hypothetical protein